VTGLENNTCGVENSVHMPDGRWEDHAALLAARNYYPSADGLAAQQPKLEKSRYASLRATSLA
jgi:hypothetical protein